jgi:phosphoglycerol transferase MdoB-like AlkP superfamily enzyme
MKKLSRLDYRSLKENIYVGLCLYLGLIMVLFTFCRLGFYLFNYSYFKDLDRPTFLYIFLGGIKFDLTAVLYTNALFILMMILPFKFRFNRYYQTAAKWIFFITNGIALAANVSDFIYFKFTLRRTTADVFQQFENETNMTGLIFRFLIDYWYGLVFWIMLVALVVWCYKKIKVTGPMFTNPWTFYLSSLIALPIVVALFIGGVRGGFAHSTRPITLNDANKYVKDPKDVSLVLNTPFSILRTLSKTKIQRINYYASKNELEQVYNPVHVMTDTSAFQKKNVVVIILESFSKEFCGAFNKDKENGTYKGYTPFLDSLIQHSQTYEYSFANGRKSIDGLPSVIASIPSMGVPYVLSPYSGNRISSLGSLLKSKGYHTSFFHGAPNGSMGFDAFMNIAGFDHYYGKTEYNNDNDFDGWWGIWDEKFFNFYADKLNTFPQPFMSSIFSVSSHHPFQVPVEYENKFRGGREPILKCIQYTDYALKKFFQKTSQMPWFKNTLFVITADHTSSNILFDETRTAWGYFSIPIIFYNPDNSLAGMKSEIVQQIDIMPSVLGYLHYDKDYLAFGRDVFHQNGEPFAFNYKGNVYQLFQNDFLLEFDGVKSVGLYNFRDSKTSSENLLAKNSEVSKEMELKVKAVIQQYNNRLIDNQLTVNH